MKFLVFLVFINFSCFAETDWVTKVEDYFNNELDSVSSDFIQRDSRGDISGGKIFMKRKKRMMKLSYDDPNPNVVIVKDYKLTHYDRELKEKTIVSVYSSPLAFFLERKVDLKQNAKLLSCEEKQNFVEMKFCKKDDEDVGAITLVFSKNPFQLKGWIVSENTKNIYGKQTQLVLKNPNFNGSFSEKIFDEF